MRELPENKFGYILLGEMRGGERFGVLVKADKISTIHHHDENGSLIGFGKNIGLHVVDTVDEILEQLENIHPNLR